jgi:hypothetical protein
VPDFKDIRITGFDKWQVTQGSTPELYNVPLMLSAEAPTEWAEIFGHEWGGLLYTTKREAHVRGNTVVIYDTELDEVDQYHVPQLQAIVKRTNERYRRFLQKVEDEEVRRREARQKRQIELDDLERRLTFEDGNDET